MVLGVLLLEPSLSSINLSDTLLPLVTHIDPGTVVTAQSADTDGNSFSSTSFKYIVSFYVNDSVTTDFSPLCLHVALPFCFCFPSTIGASSTASSSSSSALVS